MPAIRRVVVVCASAGGVQALQDFLVGLHVDEDVAVLATMHQPPDSRSGLVDLLRCRLGVSVDWVSEGSTVAGGRVHVVQTGQSVELSADGFHLSEGAERNRQPFDALLKQAAALFGERVCAVVLSGAGSDGAEGCAAVAEAGGRVLAQLPAESEFPGMPQTVVSRGLVQLTGSPMALAEHLNSGSLNRLSDGVSSASVEAVLTLLAKQGGPDFRLYKPGLVARRMLHRVQKLGLPSAQDLASKLHDDPRALEDLRQDLMISVTSTFRDPAMWDMLAKRIVQPMLAGSAAGSAELGASGGKRNVRAWVAACATGEEAYSVAMLLAEACRMADRVSDFQVIGTDVDARAIAMARSGCLNAAAVAGIPDALRQRWLEQGPEGPRIVGSLRKQVIFGVHDVLGDAPFGQIDLLLCRNLFIYLDETGQRLAASGFARALVDGGFLVLGRDELLPDGAAGWRPVSETHRIYRRERSSAADAAVEKRAPTRELAAGGAPLQALSEARGSFEMRDDPLDGRIGQDLRSAYESLQCMNEELYTVNDELRLVNAQLDQALHGERQATSKLQAVIASAVQPLLVLDDQGQLEHFSRSAGQLFRLRTGDEGRPLEHFANDLVWPEFAAVVRGCAGGGSESITQEVMDIRGGYWLVTAAPAGGLGRHERKVIITATDTSRLRDATRLQAMLDALPQQVAVLDEAGRIEYVNRAWRAFGSANGADLARIDIGVDYLQASTPSGATPDPFGDRAAQGVGDVLAGRVREFRMKYPCATAERMLWFLLDVTALSRPEGGCLVSHTDVTDWAGEPTLPSEEIT